MESETLWVSDSDVETLLETLCDCETETDVDEVVDCETDIEVVDVAVIVAVDVALASSHEN